MGETKTLPSALIHTKCARKFFDTPELSCHIHEPLPPTHPALRELCPICNRLFLIADVTCLMSSAYLWIGPPR